MSNKMLKRKMIKAASVGMASVIAAAPMTAYASEPVVLPENTLKVDTQEEKKEETKAVETAIDTAKTSAVTANDAMEDVSEDMLSAKGAIDPEVEYDAAEGELDALKGEVGNMKSANSDADAAESNTDQLLTDAATVASGINSTLTQKASDFDAQKSALENATTVEEAQAAYEAAVQIAADANTAYNTAVTNYNNIQGKIKSNNETIAKAQTRYNTALANAGDDLEDATTELNNALQDAKDLKAEAEAAEAALKKASAARIRIIEKQVADQEKNGTITLQERVDWNKKAAVFTQIIQDYYVPQKGGTNVKVKAANPKPGEKDVGLEASYQGNAHYYIVTYKDKDGVPQTEYLNYKLDEDGDLVIFQKEWMDIDLFRLEVTNGKKTNYYEEKEIEVDGEKQSVVVVNKKTYPVVTFEKNGEVKKYVLYDPTDAEEEQLVQVGDETSSEEDNSTTVVTNIDVENEDGEYQVDGNNNVVKVVTGKVTRVTTFEHTLTSDGVDYDSEDDAINAAKGKIENDEVKGTVKGTVETTSKTVYSADATYYSLFSATLDVTQVVAEAIWADSKDAVKEKVVDACKDLLRNIGCVFVSADKSGINVSDKLEHHIGDDPYAATGSISFTFSTGHYVEEGKDTGLWETIGDLIDYIALDSKQKGQWIAENKEIDSPVLNADYIFDDGQLFHSKLVYDVVDAEDAVAVTSYNEDDLDEKANAAAKAAVEARALELAELLGTEVTGEVWTDSVKLLNSASGLKYQYEDVTYTTSSEKTGEEEIIAKTTYHSDQMTHLVNGGMFSNENYDKYVASGYTDDSTILMFEDESKTKDLGLNAFLKEYTDKQDKYDAIESASEDVIAAYETAIANVGAIKTGLGSLEKDIYSNGSLDAKTIAKQAELTVALEKAQQDMYGEEKGASTILSSITGQLESLFTTLQEKIAALTAAQEQKPEEKPAEEQKPEEKPTEEQKPEEKPTEEQKPEEKPTEEQKPEEQKPTEEQKPEEKPTEEQKPEEQKPTEEQKPEEQKPEEQKPTEEQKPEEQKPEEQKPEEQKPEEQKPEEQKPEEQKPEEQKPTEEQKPEEQKPAEEQKQEESPVAETVTDAGEVVEEIAKPIVDQLENAENTTNGTADGEVATNPADVTVENQAAGNPADVAAENQAAGNPADVAAENQATGNPVNVAAGNLLALNPIETPMDQMNLNVDNPTPVLAANGDAVAANNDGATQTTEGTAANAEGEQKEYRQTEEVQTALSDMTLDNDVEANTVIGWWWLLAIAIFGGAGYTLYRKFQQRKVADKMNKED